GYPAIRRYRRVGPATRTADPRRPVLNLLPAPRHHSSDRRNHVMTTATVSPASEQARPQTLDLIELPDAVRDDLGRLLAAEPDPTADIDRAMARHHQIFARLPLDLLQRILDF